MKEVKSFTLISILKCIIYIYFNTFFAIYYFSISNGSILLFAKYYLIVSLVRLLCYWILSQLGKFNNKLYYLRIGISLMALCLSMIIVFKENVVKYYYLIAIIYGLSYGFYHYPQSILNKTKIKGNKKYNSIIQYCHYTSGIIVPILLGLFISLYDYFKVSYVIFLFIFAIFLLSYYINDEDYKSKKENMAHFYKKVKNDEVIQRAMILQFLRGATINGGVLSVVILLYQIIYFKTPFNIGVLESALGMFTLLTFIIHTKIKKIELFKNFNIAFLVLITIFLVFLSVKPNDIILCVCLLIMTISLSLSNYFTDDYIDNTANKLNVRFHQSEYHLILENILNIARFISFVFLFFIGIVGEKSYLCCPLIISIVPLTMYVIYINKINDKEIKK